MIYQLLLIFFSTLILSQSLMDVASTIIIIYSFVLYFKKPQKIMALDFKNNKIFIILVFAWFANIILGYIINSNLNYAAWIKYLSDIKYIVLFLSISFIFQTKRPTEKDNAIFFKKIHISFFIISVASIVFFIVRESIFVSEKLSRFDGFLGNPMAFAHSYGMLYLFLLFSSFNEILNSIKNRKDFHHFMSLKYINFFMGLVLLYFSYTRGVWLAILFTVLVAAYNISKKMFLRTFLLSFFSALLLYFISSDFKNRILYSFSNKNYDLNRWNLWKANIEIFKDHIFFGSGYGQNTELLKATYQKLQITDFTMISHAHNQILHWLAGTGIIGSLTILCFFIFLLAFHYKRSKSESSVQQISFSISISILFFLAGGLFESNFEHSKLKYVLTFILSMSCLLIQNEKKINS